MIEQYSHEHHVEYLFQTLFQQLCIQKPKDPIQFLIDILQKPQDACQVLVLGYPNSGKSSLASILAKTFNLQLISYADVTQSVAAKEFIARNEDLPSEVLVAGVAKALGSKNCWISADFPRTRAQAIGLQQAGMLPTHVLFINMDDQAILERCPANNNLLPQQNIDTMKTNVLSTVNAYKNSGTVTELQYNLPNSKIVADAVSRISGHKHATGRTFCVLGRSGAGKSSMIIDYE